MRSRCSVRSRHYRLIARPAAACGFALSLCAAAPALAQPYRWAGPQQAANDPPLPWVAAANWQRFIAGQWQPAPAPPLLNPIEFDLAALATTTAIVDLPTADIYPSLAVRSGDVRLVSGSLSITGALESGSIGESNDPCFIRIGGEAGANVAAITAASTALRSGSILIRPGSSLSAGALTIGQVLADPPVAALEAEGSTATASSLSVVAGSAMALGGVLTVSGQTTCGDIAQFNEPCYIRAGRRGGQGGPPAPGEVHLLGGLTLNAGQVSAANPGASLEVGQAGSPADAILNDRTAVAGVNDPCFLVEQGAASAIHGDLSLLRGTVAVHSGGSLTVHGGTDIGNPAAFVDPCFVPIGDPANPGPAAAEFRGGMTLLAGEVVASTAGTTLTIGTTAAPAPLLVGDPDEFNDPCFVRCELGAAATVHGDVRLQAGSIEVVSGASMVINGVLRVSEIGSVINPCFYALGDGSGPGTLTVNGFVPVAGEMQLGHASSTVTVNPAAGGGGGGIAVREQGTLGGIGTCRVSTSLSNAGVLRVGMSPGTLSVLPVNGAGGAFSQTATGRMEMELGDSAWDILAVSGPATLGGTLRLSLVAGDAPEVGDVRRIITSTGRSGMFSSIDASALAGSGLRASVIYGANFVDILIGCAADFDGNGTREVPDIFAFLSAWFAMSPDADFDGNGTIAVPDIFAFLSAWFAGCF